jgi:hypothetical protein
MGRRFADIVDKNAENPVIVDKFRGYGIVVTRTSILSSSRRRHRLVVSRT